MLRVIILLLAVAAILSGGTEVTAQSSDINFPTPLTDKQVEGMIKARPVGDSRLTTQYFVFGGEQGDIFVNVQTKNMDADIDIFALEGMRPITKMVVYSDNPDSETGRLIYLRRSEKLLLRIQGRTPDDRAATYRIKFAGSFAALKPTKDAVAEPVLAPTVAGGTPVVTGDSAAAPPAKPTSRDANTAVSPPIKKPPVVPAKPVSTNRSAAVGGTAKPVSDPLANVRLNIVFKDGTYSNAPLSEIVKFSVDKGVLTVIRKNGSIERYKMIDVEKVTIQ